MTKRIIGLFLSVLIVGACGSSTSEGDTATSPKEIFEQELLAFIDMHKNGLTPHSPIDDVKKHDAAVTARIHEYNGNKNDLGYQSKTQKGKIIIAKTYDRQFTEKDKLKSMKLYLSFEQEEDKNGGYVVHEIDIPYYKSFIEKNLPEGGTYEEFNGTDTWKYDEYRVSLGQLTGSDLELSISK